MPTLRASITAPPEGTLYYLWSHEGETSDGHRVFVLLRRRGFDASDADAARPDPVFEEFPRLAGISSASIQGRIALGQRSGARVGRVGDEPDAPWMLSSAPRHAHIAGFDLHANVIVPAADRARLEQLCRYRLRPAVAQDRLRLMGDGRVLLTLKAPWEPRRPCASCSQERARRGLRGNARYGCSLEPVGGSR